MIDRRPPRYLLVLAPAVVAATLACHRGGPGTDHHHQPTSAGDPGVDAGGEGSGEGSAGPPGYPGELISTADLDGEFLARQKLSGSFGEEEFAFEAVMQLRAGTLTVLGLTPFGTKAFVLTQTGTEVEFEALIDRELPFPAEYVLQDIHRAWLWHARLPWGDEPPDEAASTVEVAGERVTETWTAEGLTSRSFARLDGEPAGEIHIEYVGGHRRGRPAKEVVLDNGWFGYRLEIETLDWREL